MTTTNNYAQHVLAAIEKVVKAFPPTELDEKRQNNAGKVMEGVLCHRLESGGVPVEHIKYTRYRWRDGIISIRNCRVGDHHWTVIGEKTLHELEQASAESPVVHLLSFYPSEDRELHVWAIPEELVRDSLWSLTTSQKGDRTVEVFIEAQRIHKAQNSPDLSPFYRCVDLFDSESEQLAEAIKLDFAAREQKSVDSKTAEKQDEEESDNETAGVAYTSSTVDFISELAHRTDDPEWHAKNKKRYEKVLRDPTRDFVEQLRDQYIENLSAEVAAGKRHLSVLKKNDYGQGGYHDHYWFAFYDPDAGSKINSCQLFFRMLGAEQLWRYGFSMGNYCEEYTERLHAAIKQNVKAVSVFLETAPADTIVRVLLADSQKDYLPAEFAQVISEPVTDTPHPLDSPSNIIYVIREFPLSELLNHTEGLVDEVGKFFQWVWPFFQAGMTGTWPITETVLKPKLGIDEDEDAPKTIEELSQLSALPTSLLQDIEDALLTKQQVILVGPPGTSKTYVAGWFARYFARQREGQAQGKTDTLYMHANWSYEDFFVGIKPGMCQ